MCVIKVTWDPSKPHQHRNQGRHYRGMNTYYYTILLGLGGLFMTFNFLGALE